MAASLLSHPGMWNYADTRVMTSPPSALYLIWSGIIGATGAAMGGGVFSMGILEPPPAWERLGTAGLVSVAAFLMLRWALKENRRITDQAAAVSKEKDLLISTMVTEHRAAVERSNDRLIAELHSLAGGREQNTVELRALTTAIQNQRTICEYRRPA